MLTAAVFINVNHNEMTFERPAVLFCTYFKMGSHIEPGNLVLQGYSKNAGHSLGKSGHTSLHSGYV